MGDKNILLLSNGGERKILNWGESISPAYTNLKNHTSIYINETNETDET